VSNNNNTSFYGVTNFGDFELTEQLTSNLKMRLDWCFLEIGAFNTASIPTSGIYGGNAHQLTKVNDYGYNSGQVWQGVRRDWVWETGVTNASPINISGLYLNNSFYSTSTTGTYEYSIDYPNGRVIFANAINPTGTVELNHSYRNVHVFVADEQPWFREINKGSYRPDITSSGIVLSPEISTQLPCVAIDIIPRRTSKPFQLGNLVNWTYQAVTFHVLSENKPDAKKIADILFAQRDTTHTLFDINAIASGDAFPLNLMGSRVSGASMYPDLITDYRWKRCRWTNTTIQEIGEVRQGLFKWAVRTDLELVLP
jgi:hypothetical protein